jgi:hypothetical protein
MLDLIARLDAKKAHQPMCKAKFLTLTYGAYGWQAMTRAMLYEKHLRVFLQRLRRKFPGAQGFGKLSLRNAGLRIII